MKIVAKLFLACVIVAAVGLFATGIERIVWMFSGSGLFAEVPRELYRPIADIECDRPFIEVKRDGDGTLRYRCGSYWLLAHGGPSAGLTAAWPTISRRLGH